LTRKTDIKKIVPFPIQENYYTPFLQKDFIGFKEALAFKESQGKYNAVNTLGYLGKYQFGSTTLERFRIYNTKAFLKKPGITRKSICCFM
jgi:hypothetical protein